MLPDPILPSSLFFPSLKRLNRVRSGKCRKFHFIFMWGIAKIVKSSPEVQVYLLFLRFNPTERGGVTKQRAGEVLAKF